MKIRSSTSKAKELDLSYRQHQETSDVGSVQGKPFDHLVKESQEQRANEEMTLLLKEIQIQGDRLAKRFTLAEAIQYRKLISRFLSSVVNNMLEFRKYDYFDHRGRHDMYAVIKKVNHKMEELMQGVLDSEGDTLWVLGLIDDIRGLLVDLFY
jgi:uncharacterized protein YaaR (DUF327 family)